MRLSIAKFFVAVLSFFRLREMLGVKRLKLSLAWIILFGLGINHSEAQIHLEESFRNKTKSHKVTVGGSATLTAIANINEHTTSNGWLRLTPDEQDKSGYATVTQKFSSTLGIIIEFEYKAWGDFSKGKPGANTKPGDGLSVFLYDGVLQFQDSDIGPYGGALGYAARTTDNTKALNKGYVCVGFDEFGNFSSSNELNGGRSSSLVPQAIGIRGPSGVNRDKSLYIGGTSTTLGGTSIQGTTIGYSISTTTRPLDDTFYRKVRIILLPTKNQRNNKDFTIEVQLQIKPGEEFYTVIKDVFVGELPPPDLKIGFAASTGGAVANHEIRDVKITTPVNFAITKTASKIAANATSDVITYKLLVANVGNNGAKATIADILPRGLTLVDRSISFTATNGRPSNFITNGNTGNIALTNMSVDLPPGASGIITYRAQTNVTNPNVFSLTNTATITPPNGFSDQNLNDNTSTAEVFIKSIPITLNFTAPDVIRGNKATLVASIPQQAKNDVIINLQADPASSTAMLGRDYTIIGGSTQHMVIVIPQGQTSVTKEFFLASHSIVANEIKVLILSPTIVDHLYTITDKPSINIINNIPIELSFTPSKVNGGIASTLTAKIKNGLKSKNPITITLNPNITSTAVNSTNYAQLPASITIPANAQSVSITILTYITNDNSNKILYVSGTPPIDGNQYPPIADADLLIKYPPISHHITLDFNPSTVEGGEASVLTASLSGTMIAPAGGITISISKVGDNLVEIFSNHIYITAGETSATNQVTTKVNTGAITQLIVTGPNNLPGYTLNGPATLTIKPTKPEITNKQLTNTICSGNPIIIPLSSTLLNTTYKWTARSSSTHIAGFADGNGIDINQVLTNNGATSETVTYTVVPALLTNGVEVVGNSTDFVITVMPLTPKNADSSHNLNDDDIKSDIRNPDKFYDIKEIVGIQNQPGITYRWYAELDPTKPTLSNSDQLDIPIGPVGTQIYYYTEQRDGFCESERTKVTIHITRNITLKFDQPNVQGGQSSTLIANLLTANETGQDIIIDIQQTSGDAQDQINYTKPQPFQILIKDGASSGSVEVGTILATQLLGQKTAVVTGTATNYTFGGPATLTINDDPNNKTITLTFSTTTVFGGDAATLIASLPAGIKAPEGGITITVNDNSGSNAHPAKPGRDFETTELPQLIYIQKNHNSGSITITTKKDWVYRLLPEASMKRNLTVQGVSTGEYTIASTPTLIIDQHKRPIPIKLTLYSPLTRDKTSEITSGLTALLLAKVELPTGEQIASSGIVINLTVNPLLSTDISGTHYNLAGRDYINGGTTTQTITFNRQDGPQKQISIFSTLKQNIIGGRTRLAFTATCSNEKYYIVNDPFIDIIDKPANFPGVYFNPPSVMCGTSSTLTAAFFQSLILQTPSGITSVSPTIIMLTPNASSSALSGTHYSGLPASITIPAGQSSFSIPIHTVDTREVNIQRNLIVDGSSQGDDGHIITSKATLVINYQTVAKPQIDPITVLSKTICSGEPVAITLTTNPPGSLFKWTANLKEGRVTGFSDNDGGNAIVDVLRNTSTMPGKVIYAVTPITTMLNGTKVEGDATEITVTVLPISGKMTDLHSTAKDVRGIISFPVDAKPNIIYTWYDKDKNEIHNSAGIAAECVLNISEPGTYTYYMTQTEPEHCPGDFGKITITLTRSISLSFDTPTVGGGSQARLTAKLAPGITAPVGGVEILLTSVTGPSTTAKNGIHYVGLINKITIPAGANMITVDAFTATNNHLIDGSTLLALTGTGPMGYDINEPNPTITILDKTGDDPNAKIITLAFDKPLVKGGDEAILTISLPKGVTSALPIVLKLGKVKSKSTAKRRINYQTYPDFITIPANKNHIDYQLETLSEGDLGNIKSLWINGIASGYRINTAGINIKNPTKIHIPNVFTPNDDGVNDFWIIPGIDHYPRCRVTVYNRWGKEVFFSIGYAQPWDGKENRLPLPIATYYYVIDLKNGSKPLSGHVAIIK